MSRLASALAAAVGAIPGRRFALVGGIAVSARAEPRFTRDVALAVSVPDDAAAEEVVRGMTARRFRLTALVERDLAGRLATARLIAPDEPDGGVIVDLLFASSGIEREIVEASEDLEVFGGVIAPVALSGHLIATKVLSRDDARRPQDAVDLRALLEGVPEDVLALARSSVRLIQERGFDRGRDLAADLEAAVQALRG